MLGTETRVRDKVVGRHGHGLSASALQLVDHREQVVEVKLHSAQKARLRRPIGGFWAKMVAVMGGNGFLGEDGGRDGWLWVKMAAVADGVRMVEIILARMSSTALGVREVSVEAVHRDRNHRLVPQRFDHLVHHAGLP